MFAALVLARFVLFFADAVRSACGRERWPAGRGRCFRCSGASSLSWRREGSRRSSDLISWRVVFSIAPQHAALAVSQSEMAILPRRRARRAADAMHVSLRNLWQFEIDDMRDAVDADAARGDVGGDQRR